MEARGQPGADDSFNYGGGGAGGSAMGQNPYAQEVLQGSREQGSRGGPVASQLNQSAGMLDRMTRPTEHRSLSSLGPAQQQPLQFHTPGPGNRLISQRDSVPQPQRASSNSPYQLIGGAGRSPTAGVLGAAAAQQVGTAGTSIGPEGPRGDIMAARRKERLAHDLMQRHGPQNA